MNALEIIVGASYVVRWEHNWRWREQRYVSTSKRIFLGAGGAPVWDLELFEKVGKVANGATRIILMLGDHRFGNRIASANLNVNSSPFISGYRNIDRTFINPAVDTALIHRSYEALTIWRERYDRRLTIIPWSLLLRQVERDNNLTKARSINSSSKLMREIWSLDRLIEDKRIAAYDVRPLLIRKLVLSKFFIDSNLHPSPLGFHFLDAAIQYSCAELALQKAEEKIRAELVGNLKPAVGQQPVLICGNSRAVATLVKMLDRDSISALENASIYVRYTGSEELTRVIKSHQIRQVIFISDDVPYTPEEALERRFLAKNRLDLPLNVVFDFHSWEGHARRFVAKRHPDLAKLDFSSRVSDSCKTLDALNNNASLASFLNDDSIDLGEEMEPTQSGLKGILDLAMSISRSC